MVASAYSLDESITHGEGDEVWECDSEVESGSDDGSEQDSDPEVPIPLPPSPVAAQVKQVLQYKGIAPQKMPITPEVQVRKVQAQTSSPWMKGATELALHLRKDNERLRQLLVEAQREAEQALEQGQSTDKVDFAHLLELVKEFGTGGEEPEKDEEPEMCMSFKTQEFRMDEDDVDEKDLEIQRLEAELADLKEQLVTQQSGVKPLVKKLDEEGSMELVGYWVSSKTGELHQIVRADTDTDLDAPDATEWEIVEVDKECVTLKSDSGMEHTVERLKTKMFGESLLWGSGDLWTQKPHA